MTTTCPFPAQWAFGLRLMIFLASAGLLASPALAQERAVCDRLVKRARAAEAVGDIQEQLRLLRQVVPLAPGAYGQRSAQNGGILNWYANVLGEAGLYVEAEQAFRQALEIRKQVHGPRHFYTADVYNNMGCLYGDMGFYDKALPFLKRALEIRQEALGPKHLDVAQSLENIASVMKKDEDLPQIEALYGQALQIRLEKEGPEAFDVGRNRANLGADYASRQQWDKARACLEQARAIYQKHIRAQGFHTGHVLSALSDGYSYDGDYAAALAALESAKTIYERVGDPGLVARAWNNIGMVNVAMRHPAEALAAFDRSRRILRDFTAHVLPGLSENEQLAFLFVNERFKFHVQLSAALRYKDDPAARERAAEWILNSKGLAQQALAERALIARDSQDPAVSESAAELRRIRSRLARLQLALLAQEDSQLRKEFQKLSAEERKLAVQLGLADASVDRRAGWVDLAAVRAALGPNEVLVEICDFARCDFDVFYVSHPLKEHRYVACLIPPAGAGEVQLIDLGPAEAIEQALTAARQLVQQPAARDVASEQEARAALAKMRSLVLDPLLPHIGKAEQLAISPDGALWLLPWAALPLEDGTYAVERFQVRNLISGRDLLAEWMPQQVGVPVVFADPDYDLDPTAAAAATRAVLRGAAPKVAAQTRAAAAGNWHVSRLPGTAREAAAIAGPLKRLTTLEPQLYQDRWALEGVFKAVRSPAVLVLSTHGFVLDDEAIATGSLADADRKAPARIQNPLLRCGLLLAGCNRAAGAQQEDGVLTALEIVGTDLHGTDLVVLSACETGLGTVRKGEGVAGVRQAFQLAGARAVAATLWQIPDEETAELMGQFFGALAGGQDRFAALRTAQLQAIRAARAEYKSAHPYYWAAFTLTGN